MNYDYDYAVIGGGSAGYAAARTAASLGLKTVVIDGAPELGGLCILRGCMPSKTLIETADRARVMQEASTFGLRGSFDGVDLPALRARKRALIADFAGYRQQQLMDGRFTLKRGWAAFTSPHELAVNTAAGEKETLTFRAALVASGTVISVPEVPGLREIGYVTSDDILDADALPESFIVLGGGAIALELAHFLHATGRRVIIIQRSAQVLSTMDADVVHELEAAYRERGITLHTGTQLCEVTQTAGEKTVRFMSAAGEQTVSAAEILVATGRRAATDQIGAEAAGLVLKNNGQIEISTTQQTTQPHIFAAGDVCSPLEIVHIAIQQAELATRNADRLLRGEAASETMDYRLKLFGVFSEPQIASVGLTEAEARAAGHDILTATYPFNDHGKSMIMGTAHGLVKIIAERPSGRILGASVVGPEATELIHTPMAAMAYSATVSQFMTLPFYHPTLSEIWTYPAEEIAEAL
jgi:pyruvate/2-oxoglutarate dehydrogenase complex dihydrolipoamide dehydrogenase (E3) component